MRRRLKYSIFLIFLVGHFFSQKTALSKVTIATGCGFVGEISPEVFQVRELVTSKNTDELLTLTRSDNPRLKLLAVIALDNLGLESGTGEQKVYEYIAKYKKSKSVVYVCYDCGGDEPTKISTLFRKEKTPLRRHLDSAIEPRT